MWSVLLSQKGTGPSDRIIQIYIAIILLATSNTAKVNKLFSTFILDHKYILYLGLFIFCSSHKFSTY